MAIHMCHLANDHQESTTRRMDKMLTDTKRLQARLRSSCSRHLFTSSPTLINIPKSRGHPLVTASSAVNDIVPIQRSDISASLCSLAMCSFFCHPCIARPVDMMTCRYYDMVQDSQQPSERKENPESGKTVVRIGMVHRWRRFVRDLPLHASSCSFVRPLLCLDRNMKASQRC